MDDNEIVQLFRDRNEAALSAMEKKHGRRCRTVAENILNNREDAEECVNEAYMKLWELIPPHCPEALGAFLCRIVRNTAINVLKAKNTEKRGKGTAAVAFEELEECIPDKSSVEHIYENKELLAAVNRFLRQTSIESRRIFVLRYWYCCDLSEIAERFGTRKNTVSVILNRTRKRLRKYLEEEGYEL